MNGPDSSPAVEPAKPAARFGWMDLSRGLGVMLIVFVHAGSIFKETSGIPQPDWFYDLDLAFAPYRVPLLIFLSGILLQRSLAKGLEKYVQGKLQNLIWPFFIWTALFMIARDGIDGLFQIRPWLGGTTLWFMSFLIFYFAIGAVFARVPVLLIAVYALAIAMIAPTETRYGSRLFVLMAYFFCGAYAGQRLETFTDVIRGRWVLATLPLIAAVTVYLTVLENSLKYSPFAFPLLLACIVGVCALFTYLARGPIGRVFTFIGRNSLIYYVVHPPVYFVAFDIFYANGIMDPVFCIFTALFLGIFLATCLALLAGRNRWVSLLFKSPDFRFGPRAKALLAWAERMFFPSGLTRKPG